MRTIFIIAIATFAIGCAGSKGAQPDGIRTWIAQRSQALASLEPTRIADTISGSYLQDCETRAQATERWTRAIDGATAVRVVNVSVTERIYAPHTDLAYFRASWRIEIDRGNETEVLFTQGEFWLWRRDTGVWREWGNQACQ